MGKKSAKANVLMRKKDNKHAIPSESESDLDEFYSERDKILLERDDQYSSDDLDQEEVLAVEEDSELETEEEQEVLAQVPGLRKYLKKRTDDDGDEEEVEQDDQMAWGARKQMFYNDDADYDDEAIADELEEAQKMQKMRLEEMEEDDFVDDEFQDSMGHAKKGSLVRKDVNSDSKVVQDVDAELEKISLTPSSDDLQKPENMSKKQVLNHLKSTSPELLALLNDFGQKVDDLKDRASTLLKRIETGELETDEGISLLDVKNQLMVNYLLNLSFYFYLKLSGKTIQNHPVVEKLVELRLFMEKLKPVEAKIQNQIDRLVKTGAMGEGGSDGLNFRPDASAFDLDQGSSDDAEFDDGEKLYRPPKIAPVSYDEDPKQKAEKKERISRASERLLQDTLMEFDEAPEEIVREGEVYNVDINKEKDWMERVKVEEDLMTRLPMKKSEKKAMKMKLRNELQDLSEFGDSSLLQAPAQHKVTSGSYQSDEDNQEDDEYYVEMKQKAMEKREKKSRERDMDFDIEEEVEVEGKREIGYDIMKNRGLTPKRTKEQRNPRVKRRKKFESSMVKLKSFKPINKKEGKYVGEETGIRKNLARGVKFSS